MRNTLRIDNNVDDENILMESDINKWNTDNPIDIENNSNARVNREMNNERKNGMRGRDFLGKKEFNLLPY